MKHAQRILLRMAIAALALQTGCTSAHYSRLHLQVVDEQTGKGISNARIHTYYSKPMWDLTYQRKDREKTDTNGFATLTVATNWSQRTIVGWTHGISLQLSVQASGYRLRRDGFRLQEDGFPLGTFSPDTLLVIQMQRTGERDKAIKAKSPQLPHSAASQ